eukprot:5851933-Alexandrium_andersonii.AAC.1
MGARVAEDKCLLFSTCAQVRAAMRLKVWRAINSKITVALSARDLGAHLSFGRVRSANTLKVRSPESQR